MVDNKNKIVNNIKFLYKRYENFCNQYRTISFIYKNSIRNLTIVLNLNFFPHALGLQKIPFFKNKKPNKIISIIKRRNLKNIHSLNNNHIVELTRKIKVLDWFLNLFENNLDIIHKYKTYIIKDVQISKKIFLKFAIVSEEEKEKFNVIGVKLFDRKKYMHDYSCILTLMLLDKNSSKIKIIEQIEKNEIEKIYLNKKKLKYSSCI